MTGKLTDLKQLTKAILKESPPSRVEPAPVARPAPTVSDAELKAALGEVASVAKVEPTKPAQGLKK